MEIKPDIALENDYIRIVYEVITSNLRTNKKIIEKELNTIITKILQFKKKPIPCKESLSSIKALNKRLKELREKVLF